MIGDMLRQITALPLPNLIVLGVVIALLVLAVIAFKM